MVAQGAFQDPLRLRVSLMGAAPCRRAAICQAVSVPSKETGRQPHSPSLIALPVKTELGQAARLRAAVSSAASQTRGAGSALLRGARRHCMGWCPARQLGSASQEEEGSNEPMMVKRRSPPLSLRARSSAGRCRQARLQDAQLAKGDLQRLGHLRPCRGSPSRPT